MWKKFPECTPTDDRNYLVCWLQADGKYSIPHKAYYCSEEGKFFMLDTLGHIPIYVDAYIELAPPYRASVSH